MHLELYARQDYLVHTYLLQRLTPFILTLVFPWYFPSYFHLAILESHCPFLSFRVIFLHLDPIIWDPLVPPCHMQVHPSRNYIPVVISSPNYTSLPSTVATFFATCLMAVLQPSRYSIFYGRDTPIWLSLPWQSYPCQCWDTETSTWSNRGFTTETLSISYNIYLYIKLVVIL